MKRMLFSALVINLGIVTAVGFDTGTPGYVVNGGMDAKPKISREKELKDQLLTVPIFITDRDTNDIRLCTGTLVGDKSVLTAKHCIDGLISQYDIAHANWENRLLDYRKYAINVAMYTHEALKPSYIRDYGTVYKFTPIGPFIKNTPYDDILWENSYYFAPDDGYQIISAGEINTMAAGSDMVLLKLDSRPGIIYPNGPIDPKNDVVFNSSIRNFILDAAEDTDLKYTEAYSANFEFLGFGMPSERTLETDVSKAYLNLRSGAPTITPFFHCPAAARQSGYSLQNCFLVTFVKQGADQADSGAVFSYIKPLPGGKKKVIGVISRSAKLKTKRDNKLLPTVIVEGFTDEMIERLNALRNAT